VAERKKTDEKAEDRTAEGSRSAGRSTGRVTVNKVRLRLAQAIWLVAVVCALFLAVGALCVALDANRDNALVKLVLDVAKVLDLSVFSPDNGIFKFHGSDAATKNALANWGLGAVAYLVVGRVLERIVRP
jgi:hypothetical protein